MVFVSFALSVFVAVEACELGEIARHYVTSLASRPLAPMGAGKYWKEPIVMIFESRASPGIVRMTG